MEKKHLEISLTVNNWALAKVSDEKIHIQGSTGENELQRRDLRQHVPQLGQEEIGQAVPLVNLVLRKCKVDAHSKQ